MLPGYLSHHSLHILDHDRAPLRLERVGVGAGRCSGDGGISGSGNLLALHLDHGGSNAADAHSPPQADEAILAPASSPRVLDQSVGHSIVSAVITLRL